MPEMKISLVEFEKISSLGLEKRSDETLLNICRCLEIGNGYGVIAEVLKRFNRRKK